MKIQVLKQKYIFVYFYFNNLSTFKVNGKLVKSIINLFNLSKFSTKTVKVYILNSFFVIVLIDSIVILLVDALVIIFNKLSSVLVYINRSV